MISRIVRRSHPYRCPICNQTHPLKHCYRFLTLNVLDRINLVNRKRICRNCLACSHDTELCTSDICCRICHRSHHTLLHFHDRLGSVRNAEQNHVVVQPEPWSDPNSIILKPTALVKVYSDDQVQLVRALINPQQDRTSITRSMARRLRVAFIRSGDTRCCQLTICSSHGGTFSLRVVCLIVDQDFKLYPSEEGADRRLLNNEFAHWCLADPTFFRPQPIDLILGADLYPRLIRPQTCTRPGLPLAQSTELGWTFCGACPRAN